MIRNFARSAKFVYIFALVCGPLLMGGVALILNKSAKLQKSQSLVSGLRICFERVEQSYLAHIRSSQQHAALERPFFSLTSECFAEVIEITGAMSIKNKEQLTKLLNRLSTDAYWFHEKIYRERGPFGLEEGTPQSHIHEKYAGLELIRNQILDILEPPLEKAAKVYKYLLYAQFMLITLTVAVLTLLAWVIFKTTTFFGQMEQEALVYFSLDNSQKDQSTTNPLIKLLDRLQLSQLSQMARQWQLAAEDQNQSVASQDALAVHTNNINEALIEAKKIPRAPLSDLLTSTLQSSSQKAFQHGVFIDWSSEDELWIEGESEVINQILISALSVAFSHALTLPWNRKIKIQAKSLGGLVPVRFYIKEAQFGADDIQGNYQDSNLKIVTELAKDMKVSVSLKNSFDEKTKSKESVLEIVFNKSQEAPTPTVQVVDVVKGKKHQLMAKFKSEKSKRQMEGDRAVVD